MAPSSPRRSSRARQTQPPTQSGNGNTNSAGNSVSSSSSTRAERNTRSHNQQASPTKSSTPQSLSSDALSEPTRARESEPPPIRRSRRQHEHNEDLMATRPEDDAEDEAVEDEGTIRCICGRQDYPGPATDGLPDAQIDFVMCDSCKVWQHGGCVGIFDDNTNPENYFCEECKPHLHQLMKGYSGQRYSRYLPVGEKPKTSHRKASLSKGPEVKSREKVDKNSRAALEHLTKRRSTMNSRATYDEEEVLRKVIEESKSEGQSAQESSARKGKRGRDESEDIKREPKRQRTRTDSVGSSESDMAMQDVEGLTAKQLEAKRAAIRGAALQKQREKEQKEKERERAEAANKRKGRAERRRGDDSPEPPDSTPKPSTATAATTSQTPQAEAHSGSQPPDTPASTAQATNGNGSGAGGPGTHKRGSRHPAKRGGRNNPRSGGREDGMENASPTRRTGNSPSGEGTGSGADSTSGGGSTSAATNHHAGSTATATTNHHGGNGHSKRGRHAQNGTTPGATHAHPGGTTPSSHAAGTSNSTAPGRDPSLLEMRKKAGAMATYIREAEVENARWTERGIAEAVAHMKAGTGGAEVVGSSGGAGEEVMRLAADLATKLVKWEGEFGKWPDK